MKRVFLIIFVLILLTASKLVAQDVTHLFDRFKQKPKITGGISTSQIFYAVNGIDPRRNPYTYFINANLNLSVFGWNLPLSASYSNQDFQYTYPTYKILPFNQLGISPSYKWVKLYLGYNSMSFSPYSMSGRTFYGAGIELKPGIFNLSFMYGKIQNAVNVDSVNIVPAYKRMAFAVKAGVRKSNDFIDFVLFSAVDDTNSILIPITSEIQPMQNLVFNVNAGKVLFKKVSLNVEFASSALTKDLRKEPSNVDVPYFYSNTNFLLLNRVSTNFQNAFKTNVTYAEKNFTLGLGYERVDPEYQSLGAYYFTNDFENLTINSTLKLINNKLNISWNFGGQRNNLSQDKLSQSERLVGSINSAISFSPKFNLSLNYSNFSSYTFIKNQFDDVTQQNPYQYLDTLNFTQITQSAGANASFLFGDINDKNQKKSLNINLNYQKASEQQADYNENSGSNFFNGNIAFMYNYVPLKLSVTTSFATSYNSSSDNNILTLGPSVSLGKVFFENKIRTVFSSSYSQILGNGIKTTEVLNMRFNASYILKKKHNFGLSLLTLNRFKTEISDNPKFFEFTGTINYSFNF